MERFKISTLVLLIGICIFALGTSVLFAATDKEREEARLRAELEQIYKEIAQKEAELKNQRQNSASLERDVSILASEIKKLRLSIQARQLEIRNLSEEIVEKEETIDELNSKMERQKQSLAEIIRRTNELDSYTTLEIVLSNQTLSGFLSDHDTFKVIEKSLKQSFNEIRALQTETDEAKQQLEEKRSKETDTKVELESNKQSVEKKEGQQKQLLSISKNKEKQYQVVLADRQARAAQIRAALFELRDVPQGGIPFGDALEYAKEASARTGVRPAFVLAILKQESNLGKNVGTCNRPGDVRTWRQIMPGPGQSWRDDQAAFLRVTKELGLSPDGLPLSCPLASGGWGGAMGPAQFIPTTWEGIKSKLASVLGIAVPNPWQPRHAIMASALFLKDLGASSGGYTAEWNAACRYYSGKPCTAPNVRNAFYGHAVMAISKDIQENMINPLEGL